MLRFGAFALDEARGELRRNGVLIRLQRQPLTALALLAGRAGEVVSREELRRAIWPEGTFVDFERGLNFCINRIRRTLDEDARAPRYIETVPRLGYRFIAAVTRTDVPAAPRPLASRVRRPALAAAVTLALLVSGQDAGSRTPRAGPAGRRRPRRLRARPLPGAHGRTAGRTSLRAFEEASRLDPRNAAVAAALAQSWVRAVQEGRVSPREGMPKARAAGRARRRAGRSSRRAISCWASVRAAPRLGLGRRGAQPGPRAGPGSRLRGRAPRDGRPAAGARTARRPRCARRSARSGSIRCAPWCAARWRAATTRRGGSARRRTAWRRSALVAPALVGPHERLFHAYRHAARAGDAVEEAARVVSLLGGPASPFQNQPREPRDRVLRPRHHRLPRARRGAHAVAVRRPHRRPARRARRSSGGAAVAGARGARAHHDPARDPRHRSRPRQPARRPGVPRAARPAPAVVSPASGGTSLLISKWVGRDLSAAETLGGGRGDP